MISVIVPAFNARQTLGNCLRAMQQQTIPCSAYEIIVVDDGSTDETAAIARQANVQLVVQAHGGRSIARNAGAAAARGDLLLFTDADCEPTADWIAQMAAPFADEQVCGAKGVYRTCQRELMARFVQLEYEDKYDRMAKQPSIDFIDAYSAAYRRDTFLVNGGFDPVLRLGIEDQEFSFRLSQKGYRLVFAPRAVVYHQHARTLRQYVRRKFDIGYWKALLLRWYPGKLASDSHTPQVMKVQIGLAALAIANLPLSLFSALAALAELLLLALFMLTAIPFVAKAARKDWAVALIAPVYLWCRAVGLGFGLLAGFLTNTELRERRKPVLSALQRAVKRGIDLMLGSLALLVCLPLWLVIAILIKLDSRGSVFFVQPRVGENGRVFNLYKFRTMVDGAAALSVDRVGNGPIGSAPLKLPNDPRVTRIGRVLRRTSLDETPNFINVLRGEMSLVGPRPEEVRVVALYNDWHRRRLAVKPGITGPMQINGRGALNLDERVQLELDYIEHYSPRKDLQIMFKTIPAVIRGDGAY